MGDVVGGFVDNTLGTNIFGQNANEQGLQAQTAATQAAMGSITNAYNDAKSNLAPWQLAGTNALGALTDPNFGKNIEMDPGYQFRLDEGNKAITNAMAARGLGNSGAALKELTRYGQNFASNEYNNAYNRKFNQLNTLAGYGNNAANNSANLATGYGGNIANLQTGLGNAQAGAAMGRANQMQNAIGQATSIAALISDERLKTEIMPIPKEDLEEMRSTLKAFYFKYKDELHGKGEWAGAMAQDLEKSKLGKTLVFEDENGRKQINQNKLLSMFLATMAEAA